MLRRSLIFINVRCKHESFPNLNFGSLGAVRVMKSTPKLVLVSSEASTLYLRFTKYKCQMGILWECCVIMESLKCYFSEWAAWKSKYAKTQKFEFCFSFLKSQRSKSSALSMSNVFCLPDNYSLFGCTIRNTPKIIIWNSNRKKRIQI